MDTGSESLDDAEGRYTNSDEDVYDEDMPDEEGSGDSGDEDNSDNDDLMEDEEDDESDSEDSKKFKKKIGMLLDSAFQTQSQGSFAGYGSLPNAPNPGVEIEGLGLIGSPLSFADAKRIISMSEEAPFGKKDKTIVDPLVRRTWQIDSSKIRFLNRKWEPYVRDEIIPEVAEKLGLDAERIEAHLYKLLLYGVDGHFDAHQDTEKEPGMFGTLIIVLPSPFTGGSVTASHGSTEMVFDTSLDSDFGTSFTCIYSDVFHKVHPVVSGYRFVLSYNLIFKSASGGEVTKPVIPVPSDSIIKLRALLKKWVDSRGNPDGPSLPRFIAHILDHQYSKVGLSFNIMKGRDRAKVKYLKEAAAELGLSIYLAQFDVKIKVYEGPYYEESTSKMEDFETKYIVKDAVDVDGKERKLSNMIKDKNDTIPPINVNEWKADRKKNGEFTGNEGCDVFHYYFRTLLFIWPKSQDIRLSIKSGGVKAVASDINEKVGQYEMRLKTGGNTDTDRKELEGFISAIFSIFDDLRDPSPCFDAIAGAALVLEDVDMFLHVAKEESSHKISVSKWIEGVQKFKFDVLQVAIDEMLKKSLYDDYAYDADHKGALWCAQFIEQLSDMISNDPKVKHWAEKQMIVYLSKIENVNDDGFEFLSKKISQRGFAKYKDTLSSILSQAYSRSNRASSEYTFSARPGYSSFELIDKVFETFKSDKDAAVWCRESLLQELGNIDPKDGTANIRPVFAFIRKCFHSDVAHWQSFVPEILHSLQHLSKESDPRKAYSMKFLTAVIQPFAVSLRPLLEDKSLSFKNEPYDAFARHFITAAKRIYEKPSPKPVPPKNYTFPEVGNAHVDGFLRSSVRHVLTIRDGLNTRKQIEKALARLGDRVSMTTVEKGMPHALVIRKSHESAASRRDHDEVLEKLLNWETVQEWKSALCNQPKSCDCCQRIQSCLSWYEVRTKHEEFILSFGSSETVADIMNQSQDGHASTSTMTSNEVKSVTSMGKKLISASNVKKRAAEDVIDLTSDEPSAAKKRK